MVDVIDVRAFYKKTGRIKYISHLDINRCMQRAMKRAKLPVWHTEGFNPHLYLTFALPLSLGYESEYETMDFRLIEEMDFQEVQNRLNSALPEGLEIFKVALKKSKFDVITCANYEVDLYTNDVKDLAGKFADFMSEPWIEVEKKTKKGMKKLDIKAEIQSYSVESHDEFFKLYITLPAGGQTINPGLLTDEFARVYPGIVTKIDFMRKSVQCTDGSLFE